MKDKMLSKTEFDEIRAYCHERGLDILTYLKERRETNSQPAKEKPSSQIFLEGTKIISKKESYVPTKKSEIKSKKTDRIIKDVLHGFEELKGKDISLDLVVESVQNALTGHNLGIEANCPLKGYLSKLLYSMVQINKNKEKGIKGWRYSKEIKHPVIRTEFNDFSKIKFDAQSLNHIVGHLSPDYVLKNYKLTENGFVDEKGIPCNIEATLSWAGEHKANSRQMFCDFIEKHLLNPLAEKKSELEKKLEETEIVLEKPREKEITGCFFKAEQKGAFISFKHDRYLQLYHPLIEIPNTIIKSHGTQGFNISWSDEKSRQEVEKMINKIRKYQESGKYDFLKNGLKIMEIKVQRKPLTEENGGIEKKELEKRLNNLKEINYLGLEGTGFGSFLELRNITSKFGFNLSALIPEYHYREANIMKSIAKAYPKKFSSAEIINKDVNDFIFLSLADSPHISFKIWRRRGSVGCKYYNKNDDVKEKTIPLETYQEISSHINNGMDIVEFEKRYKNLPPQLYESIANCRKEKFDIVFLDYYSGNKTPKRNKALEKLPEILKDEAVVGITTNLSPKIVGKNSEKVLEEEYNKIDLLFENAGREVKEFDYMVYQDKKDKMGLIVLYSKIK